MDLKSVEPSPSSHRSKSNNHLVRPPILNPQSENTGAGRRIAVMLKSGAGKNQVTPQKPAEKKPSSSTSQGQNKNQIHIEKVRIKMRMLNYPSSHRKRLNNSELSF